MTEVDLTEAQLRFMNFLEGKDARPQLTLVTNLNENQAGEVRTEFRLMMNAQERALFPLTVKYEDVEWGGGRRVVVARPRVRV